MSIEQSVIDQSVGQSSSLEDISYSTPTVKKNSSKEISISTPYSLLYTKFGSYKPMEWTIEVK